MTLADRFWIAVIAAACVLCAPESYAGECEDRNFDAWVVGKALEQGMKQEDLLAFARHSPEIDAHRFKRIEGMVRDAFQYTPDSAPVWYEEQLHICEDET